METEGKIILAALREFEARGFAAATTKAIAAEAGVAEVTLFRIFGDKRTLFTRVLQYISEVFGLPEIPNSASGDLRQDIHRLCQTQLGNFIEYNPLFRMLSFEAKNHPDIRAVLVNIRSRAFENVKTLVGQYIAVDGDAQITARLEWLANTLMGSSLSYCLFHAEEDRKAYIRLHAGITADAFLEGVSKPEKR